MARHRPAGGRPGNRGFALIVLLALLASGVLYFLMRQLDANSLASARAQNTADALTQAKDALLAYAITYRDGHPNEVFGYLPCPDTDGDGSADTAMTAAGCGAAGESVIGLLPFKTLGLPDLRDSTGECLWYAVSGSFKASITKPTPMNWDTQGQFSILDPAGNALVAPNDANGGSAAAIFAAGAPLGARTVAGQNLAAQDRASDATKPCGRDGTGYAAYVDFPYGFPSAAATVALRTGPVTDTANPNALPDSGINDRLLWITPKEVFDRIKQRGDFATFIQAGITNLQAKLTNALAAYPASAGNGLPAANPFTVGTSDYNFYENWKNQFRYFACSPGAYCYTINSESCDGALAFGGADVSGNPRAVHADANHFETPGALALVSGGFTFAGATGFDNASTASRATDLSLCLTPFPTAQTIDTTQPAQFALLTPVVSAQPLAFRDDTNQRLQLGASDVTGSGAAATPLYGCIWYPTSQALGELAATVYLRAYFRFYIADPGDGFTLTLADADPSRNPSTTMCGASAANVGYAGNNGTTSPINYPKIAIEFDRVYNAGRDPFSASYRQMAFVYWGDPAGLDDDNSHGAGGTTSPLNPADGSAGFKKSSSILDTGTMQYVRLEMERTYSTALHRATHVLRAYLMAGNTGFCADDFRDLTRNLADIDPFCSVIAPTISDTITLDDVAGAAGAPMKNIWIGFTGGQGSNDQQIYLYDLQTRISQ